MKRKRAIKDQSQDDLKDCMFYDCFYPEVHITEETEEFVTYKIREIEREIDRLSNDLKEAYYIALDEEIKQQTSYVRSQKFLLAFLRAHSFDAAKAAVRLAKFFQHKLRLFGREKLPHRIRQDDLSQDDRKVLASGWIQYGGVDCGGRSILFIHRHRLTELGLSNDHYLISIVRVYFYQTMCIVEENESCQTKKLVAIRWNFDCNQSLKDYRLLFRSFIRMAAEAIPTRFVAIHDCSNNAIANSCLAWSMSLLPKHFRDKIMIHNVKTPAECFAELSKYGIDVDNLPITLNGQVKVQSYTNPVEQQSQVLNMVGCIESISMNDRTKASSERICTNSYIQSKDSAGPSMESTTSEKIVNTNTPTTCHEDFETFALKLMEILECSRNSDAIWWSRNGTAFIIEKKRFSEKVLPHNFNGIKWDSFRRKLNRWKFQCAPRYSNNNKGAVERVLNNCTEYQNPFFRRNLPELLKEWTMYQDSCKRERLAFPMKLMNALNKSSSNNGGRGGAKAIWWICDGKAFAIDTKKISHHVLDIDFDGLLLSSFLGMLRKWGFERISFKKIDNADNNTNALVFRHALFQKNLPLSPDLRENWTHFKESMKTKKSVVPKGETFPKKLYRVLNSRNNNVKAIWWLGNGIAFVIDVENFSSCVLTTEFNGIEFSSFKRNLKRWGFQEVKGEKLDTNLLIFQHGLFKKDAPELLERWPPLSEGSTSKLDSPLNEDNDFNQQFPKKLLRILESKVALNAIWWVEEGTAFAIHAVNFSNYVLPQEFNGIKFTSFQRSLSRWGFEKSQCHGLIPGVTIYRKPPFQTNIPELMESNGLSRRFTK